MVEKCIGSCGLTCSDCGAYLATHKDDDELREEVARKWTREYGHLFSKKDINCDGCLSTGRHVGYCSTCQIRKCAAERNMPNCAWCSEYPCEKLSEFFEMAPHCRTTLDSIRQVLR